LKYGVLSNNYQIETFALIKKGIYYNCIKSYDNALICFNKAKEIYEAHNDVEDRMYVYKLIAINKACKANPEIYDAFYKYLDLKDSLFKAESNKKTAEYKVLYETEKKDREIKLQTAETQNQKNRNSIQLLLFLGLIMTITFVAVFVFFQQKNRQNAKLLLETNRLEKLRFKAVIESEEKERKRIAEELHDGLGQLLSTAKMNVASLDDAVALSDAEDKVVFQTSLSLIDEAVSEVRNISHNLMPGALIKLGLIPAISDLVKKINTSGKMKIDFDYDTNFEKLNETSEIAIFRIVQEILNNSIKHSQAKNMTIELKKMGAEILLLITDNGIGLDVSKIEKSKGIGWKNIHSRVAILNGVIDIQSIKNSGTKIRITLNISYAT
jgi:two-component system NarL family sensor kinase